MIKYVRSLEVLVDIQVSPQALPHPPHSHQRSFPSLPETTMQLSTKHFLIMHFDRFMSHPSQSNFFSSQNSSRACFADLRGGWIKSPSKFVLPLQPEMALAKLRFFYHPTSVRELTNLPVTVGITFTSHLWGFSLLLLVARLAGW